MSRIEFHAAPPLLPDARWRLSWLLAAPHRLCFFAAAVLLGGSALWWAAALLLRAQGIVLPWAVQPSLAHSLLMGFGFMPLFFAGFLFTAGPKWLHVQAPDAGVLVTPVAAMGLGWLALGVGAHAHALLAGVGVAIVALGWSALVLRFAGLVKASHVPDQTHARLIATACAFGVAMLWLAAAGLVADHPALVRGAVHAGIWGCLAMVFAVVAHRMIPFFTASALSERDTWRPMALLWTFVAAIAFEVPFALAEAFWWPLPGGMRWAQAMVEAPVGALLIWLAWRWGLVQSLQVRLLAMLHLGFLWLGIAFVLAAISHLMMSAGRAELSLGLAPLHALTMGFLGSTLVAMATRVSCGHGGRALAADDIVWRLFWLLQLAVLLRVAGALLPHWSAALLGAAAVAWAACMAAWALRYGSWYGRPRADGRPG